MQLQRHILTVVCQAGAAFSDPRAGAEALKQSLLAAPPFLIILDDLWEDPARPDMLQWLLPPEVAKACSSNGSWVVVTTRDSSIVTTLLGPGTAREVPVSVLGGGGGVTWCDTVTDSQPFLPMVEKLHTPLPLGAPANAKEQHYQTVCTDIKNVLQGQVKQLSA